MELRRSALEVQFATNSKSALIAEQIDGVSAGEKNFFKKDDVICITYRREGWKTNQIQKY